MSTPIKIVLMLLAWLLYSLTAYQGCVRQCCEAPAAGLSTEADSSSRLPLDFGWGEAEPQRQAGYAAWRSRLLAGQQAGRQLELTGLYYESEAPPAGYDNLGFARAEAVARLLADSVPSARLRARALADDAGQRDRRFGALEAAWKEEAAPAEAEAPEQAEVEQLADRTIIRFPYNSDQMIADPVIDAYVERLAGRLAKSGERVQLTGHTDNAGGPAYNQRLGQQRAEAIKRLLVGKGIEAARISTASKGQTQPVDNNTSEEGRRNNRRVELRIVAAD